MKLNRIISFTIGNSLFLFIFGALLASCQKKAFQPHGALTKLKNSTGRSIASLHNTVPHFSSYQDPKQIILFCENTTKKVKVCYDKYITETLTEFKKNHPKLRNEQLDNLRETTDFQVVKQNFNEIVAIVMKKNQKNIQSLVNSRSEFCEKHSKYDLNKCLTQYIEKDTFTILNQFHAHNKLNGHEYIYFKDQFRKDLESKLQMASEKINLKRKTI